MDNAADGDLIKTIRVNPFMSMSLTEETHDKYQENVRFGKKTRSNLNKYFSIKNQRGNEEQLPDEHSSSKEYYYSPNYKISRITQVKCPPRNEAEKQNEEIIQCNGKKNLSSQIHALIMKKKQKKLKKINGLRNEQYLSTKQEEKLPVNKIPSDNNNSAPESNFNHVAPSTSFSCMLTGSCPELSELNEFYQCYGEEFEFDTNPILSKALSNSVEGINSKQLIDLDKQIVKELQLEDKFKKLSTGQPIDEDSFIFDKLIESQIISAKKIPNPGKGIKSIKEEIEENEYFKKNLVVHATENGPQTELWSENDNGDTKLKTSFNYKLPRTTYIEEDMDTDMQIVVNCLEDNKTGLFHRPRTRVCCVLM